MGSLISKKLDEPEPDIIIEEPKKELCVGCYAETQVDVGTHIDKRLHYIEGAGQLCPECWGKLCEKKTEKI